MNTKPNIKRILCYGDSYTWGYIPSSGHERFPADIRWTGILQQKLGKDYEVIEEGLNSRTLNSDDQRDGKEGRNGSTYLIPCLDTHDPIDLVILMLGTNELKDSFQTTNEQFASVVENYYVKTIQNRKSQFSDKTPKLLLISPPILDLTKEYAQKRYSRSKELNEYLPVMYKQIAERNGCEFLSSSDFVTVGSDGVHIDADNHRLLGEGIFNKIKTMTP